MNNVTSNMNNKKAIIDMGLGFLMMRNLTDLFR
ncbi:Uncharacterised protein [Salmonella enterica]|nr:Uncharacterised protein [Salmonella enterica]